jgi:hypothetical protein
MNVHIGRGQLLVTTVDDPAVKDVPTSPAVVPNGPKQVLQDYDSLMIALIQKFSATLATIAEVMAAETDAAARRLFTTPEQRFLRAIRGVPAQLLPPVDSMEHLWHDAEREAVENRLRAAIAGADAT